MEKRIKKNTFKRTQAIEYRTRVAKTATAAGGVDVSFVLYAS